MNILARILGLIDGQIDLGSITGIFWRVSAIVTRVPELIHRARLLASKFKTDPLWASGASAGAELQEFFADLQELFSDIKNILKTDSGEQISASDIIALRKHGADLYGRRGKDLPDESTPPPPATTFPYGKQLTIPPRNMAEDPPLRVGDVVWHNDTPERWVVFSADDPDRYDRPGTEGGWAVLETIT